MEEQILKLEQDATNEINLAKNIAELFSVNVKYLGKQGKLTEILRGMKDVLPENRKVVGQKVNDTRDKLENLIKTVKIKFENCVLDEKLKNKMVDISEPAQNFCQGEKHPTQKIFDKLIDTCVEFGFEVVDGPEVELDYYNFEKLNVPKDHPARDMQDSFYINDNILLRTQTSSVQIREMEKRKPPFKIVSPGKTYRVDSDATHTPVFHQFEALVVDENVSMVDLKNMLSYLLKTIFGENTKVRFRPSYFPFTEPSVEVDATCPYCKGNGCSMCKQTGFIELLGAGMVHKNVLEMSGIDSKKYRGFAFGPGVDRLAMVNYEIPDLRSMFENDIRFLKQFGGENK
ncbi:MAG: phenylalanine--tRNA ligase subunit alpha [Clostridia bacterium]